MRHNTMKKIKIPKKEYVLFYGPDFSHKNTIKRFERLKDAKAFVSQYKIDIFQLSRFDYFNDGWGFKEVVLFEDSPEHRRAKYDDARAQAWDLQRQGQRVKVPKKPIPLCHKWSVAQ